MYFNESIQFRGLLQSFLREGELRTHRSQGWKGVPTPTQLLQPPKPWTDLQGSAGEAGWATALGRAPGAHATACVQRAGLGISSVRQFCTRRRKRDRKQDLGMGLSPGRSENEQGNKEKHLLGFCLLRLCSAEGTVPLYSMAQGEGQAWNLRPHAY